MPFLIAVRHAPVAALGLCYGRHDVEANVPAPVVAEEIRRTLAARRVRPERVWSSPARRCAEPAERLGTLLNVPHVVSADLWELDFGRWEGRPWHWIEAHDARLYWRWMQRWRDGAPPGGESVRSLEARVRGWWERLDRQGTDLLVGHAGVIRALRVQRGGVDWADALAEPVPPLALVVFV